MEQQPYRLVFEGPADNTDETLRNLKATFITELEYSISEVQSVLQNAPLTLQSADGEEDLLNCYEALKAAGANVLIVRPELESDIEAEQSEENLDEEDERVEEYEASDDYDDADSENELVFELEVDDLLEEHTEEKKPPRNTTYSLDFNPDDSMAQIEDEDLQDDGELSFDDAVEAPVQLSEETEDEQSHISSDSEPTLSFDSQESSIEKPAREEHAVSTSSTEESGNELTLSFEDPEEEVSVVAAEEDREEVDLSIPDEPLFSFESESSTESDSEEEGLLFQDSSKKDKEMPSSKEETADTKDSVPDEPLFSFDEHEDVKPQETATSVPSDTPSSSESSATDLSFADDSTPDSAESQSQKPQEVMSANQQEPIDQEEAELVSNNDEVEDQILEALGSIDQAFETTLEEDSTQDASPTPREIEAHAEPAQPAFETEESISEQKTLIPDKKVPSPSPQKHKTQLSQVHNPLAIVLLFIIFSASAFLIYLNFLRDPANNGLTEEAIAKAIQSSALSAKKQAIEQKKEATKKSSAPAEKLTFRKLESQGKQSGIETTWSLTARGPRLISGSMKIETPKPAELTPEEIVRGMQVRPWLRKIDLFSLNFTLKEGTTYIESTQARAYIEQGDIRRRVAAHAEIQLTYDTENDKLKGEVTVRYPEGMAEKESPLHVARTKKSYEIYFKHAFEAPAGGKVLEE